MGRGKDGMDNVRYLCLGDVALKTGYHDGIVSRCQNNLIPRLLVFIQVEDDCLLVDLRWVAGGKKRDVCMMLSMEIPE